LDVTREATMQHRHSRRGLWADIVVIGGALTVIAFSLISAYLHWRDSHDAAAVERVTKPFRKNP
jgi:hypothetical protein